MYICICHNIHMHMCKYNTRNSTIAIKQLLSTCKDIYCHVRIHPQVMYKYMYMCTCEHEQNEKGFQSTTCIINFGIRISCNVCEILIKIHVHVNGSREVSCSMLSAFLDLQSTGQTITVLRPLQIYSSYLQQNNEIIFHHKGDMQANISSLKKAIPKSIQYNPI